MSLKDRIRKLEAQAVENEPPKPGLVYFSESETEAEARQRYEQQHGYPLPIGMPVIRIDTVDMSK